MILLTGMKTKLVPILYLFLVSIALFLHPFEGNGDFWHHVNTGRYIIENLKFPNLDTFSFTANGLPWIAHSWGAGFIFYLLLTFSGIVSISVLTMLVAFVTLYLLYILLRSYGPNKFASLLAVTATAVALSTRFPQRPEIFAYPLTILILLVESKRKENPSIIYLLPIIILIWANLYGSSVLFGVGLIGLLVIRQFIVDGLKYKAINIKLYAVSLVAFIAAFLNPYTYKTVFYFYLYIPQVSTYEGEWAGILKILNNMPFYQLVVLQYLILIYFLFVSLYLILILYSRKILRKFLFQFILSLSIVLPFFAFRTFPLVAILSSPMISICIEYAVHRKNHKVITIPIILTSISFLISFFINPPALSTKQNPELEMLSNFINENHISGNAFNMGYLGGYITYKHYPNILVYFDTRDDLYTNSTAIKDLYIAFQNNGSIIPLLKKYGADFVIGDYVTDNLNYRELFYSLNYVPVYLNDRYFIIVSSKYAKDKKLKTLPFVDPFSKSATKPGQENQALSYYLKLVNKNPDSLTDRIYLASVYSALKKYDDVIKTAKEINVNEKNLLGATQNRAKFTLFAEGYLGKKDCEQTKKYLLLAAKPVSNPIFFKDTQSYIPRVLVFYELICKKDIYQSRMFLNEYLKQLTSPLEKLEVQREFTNEASRL